MKTKKQILIELYPNFMSGTWGNNEKSISEWLKDKGYNLLKFRKLKVFHLDFRCTEKYFNILIRKYEQQIITQEKTPCQT